MKSVVYPGSFDPVTNGHIDILARTSRIFDRIIVAVIHNVKKKSLFTLSERKELIKQSTKHLKNIEIECFSGLLIDYLKEKQAEVIIRGLRSVNDFQYESHMAMMNKSLAPQFETIFIVSDPRYIYISSSGVKEAALVGGDVSSMVPPLVLSQLNAKIKENLKNNETLGSIL